VKVLILVDCLDNGGLERQMALVASRLPEEYRRHVWSIEGGPFESYLRERGVPLSIHSRAARFDVSPGAALARDLQRWRPDVVHSWSWMTALAAGPLCRMLGIPHVDGMIQSGALEPAYTPLKRLGMRMATLVVANTQAGLDAWDIPAEKGRVVYNGFDESRLPPAATSGSAPARRPFTVVMTGRMVPVKHYDVVIAAARRLAERAGAWRFVLVGEGSDRERLLREADDLVRAGVVAFPEPGMEVLRIVRDADVGVLMTNPALAREGLSNSIMEYMALGLPVVCGEGGGNRELVQDGVTGFVIPPAEPDALADRLLYLHDHEAVRRAMGAAGQARIREEFSVEAMVRRMASVYTEAVALAAESRRAPYTREARQTAARPKS
jgi:glycosyltransferase involved in cell wall biosynthesis